MLTIEKLQEHKKNLEQQRDQSLDVLRQIAGAIQLATILIEAEEKEAEEKKAPEVGAEQTLHTEADVDTSS